MRFTIRSRLSTSLASFVIFVLGRCPLIPPFVRLSEAKGPCNLSPPPAYQGVLPPLSTEALKQRQPSAPSASQSASHTAHPGKYASHTRWACESDPHPTRPLPPNAPLRQSSP